MFFEFIWKYVVFMSLWPRTIKILISNWPRTRKFSQFFKNTGGEDLFLPWSRVGHALRPIFMLWLVKIWQVSLCGKFMQHLETCFLWQLKLTEFCVNLWCFQLSFSTGCTKCNTAAIKSLLLFMAGLFIGFLVFACKSGKSDFGWHRFLFHLPWYVRGFKSLKRFWPYLTAFRICISNGNIYNFMKSSTVYWASLCTFVRFETMIWPSIRFDLSFQNFRDIFSPQMERKRSEEYLVINLAEERKLWAIFLPQVHLWKKQTLRGLA